MSEKYSFEKAQNEAYEIRDKALELKLERNESGEPSGSDYSQSESTLEKEREKQEKIDNEKLTKLQESFLGKDERNEADKNYQENTERHAGEIKQYVENKAVEGVPEFYQEEYRSIMQEHFNQLQKYPIEKNCKLSLVLPAYREERVIVETLESLENQAGIDPDEFEVLVVANYPKNKKPSINEYDEKGVKVGEHPDRTKELVEEYNKKSKIKILVIEQDFPEFYTNEKGKQEKFAGVGIATKLGMDIALMRQQNNPQVVGYYGADTIFNLSWVKECLNGYTTEGVDAVRGKQEGIKIDNRVEDENGLHILTKEGIDRVTNFEGRRYRYYHKLKNAINKEAVAKGRDIKKQAHGVATQTAGMYAHIGGMNIKTGGEDIANAQNISEGGKIVDNNRMLATAVGRIEEPRTEGGSYTRGLWNMYRAFQYGEENGDGFSIDSNGDLLVYDPENYRNRENALIEIPKSLKNFYENGIVDKIIEKLFSSEDIIIMQNTKKEIMDDYAKFEKEIGKSLEDGFWKNFNETYPLNKIKIEEAEKKASVGY